MLQKKQFSVEIAGKTLTIEVSALAEQANAAVIAKYGETVVLATAVMGRKDVELDYLPLKVDYEEKFYAAGKILGSRYVRREGRSSEEAILAGRLVDRTIRPLFNDKMRREIRDSLPSTPRWRVETRCFPYCKKWAAYTINHGNSLIAWFDTWAQAVAFIQGKDPARY